MPVGAILYVEVSDTTTSDDWNRWRDDFIASFDFGLDGWTEDYKKSIEAEILMPDWLDAPDYPTLGGQGHLSVWETFPQSIFLAIDLPLYTHYGPGYERGDIAEFVLHAEWLEANIPNSRVWYATDCGHAAMIFDISARQILLEYYGKVGSEPYYDKTNKEQWTELRTKYWELWIQEQDRVLNKSGKQNGIQ
jgi:hypothetical protein